MRRLRHRRLLLRKLREKYLSALEDCEALSRELEELEEIAQIAALAQPAPGGRPLGAPLELVRLREDLRHADESLMQTEGAWEHQHFDQVNARLIALWVQLDSLRGSIAIFRQRLAEATPSVSERDAAAALADHARQEREAREPGQDDIRKRIERELPRLMSRAEARVDAGGPWAMERLAEIQRALHDARSALDAGDLVAADRQSRRARAQALRLVRLVEIGLVQGSLPAGGLVASVRAALHEAGVPVGPAIGWTAAAMAFSAFMAFQVVGRLTGSTVEVLTTSGNLALSKPTRASHALDLRHGPDKAVDGNLSTAWISGASLADAQGLVIDLKAKQTLGKVMLLPQAAPSGLCRWEIDVANDSWTWTRLGHGAARGGPTAGGSEWGATDLPDGTVARYVRIRPLAWGRSGVAIFEIRAFAPSKRLGR